MAELSPSAVHSPVDAAIKIQASLIVNLPFATIISSMTLQFLKRHIAIQKHRWNTPHLATRLLHRNEWRRSLFVSTNSYFIELILSIEIPYSSLILKQLPVGLNATSFVNASNKGGLHHWIFLWWFCSRTILFIMYPHPWTSNNSIIAVFHFMTTQQSTLNRVVEVSIKICRGAEAWV